MKLTFLESVNNSINHFSNQNINSIAVLLPLVPDNGRHHLRPADSFPLQKACTLIYLHFFTKCLKTAIFAVFQKTETDVKMAGFFLQNTN